MDRQEQEGGRGAKSLSEIGCPSSVVSKSLSLQGYKFEENYTIFSSLETVEMGILVPSPSS